MPNSHAEGRRYLILIVEDDPVASAYYRDFLDEVFDIEHLDTAEAMFARLAKPPTVNGVILDMVLSNGCGLAMVSRLWRDYPQIPVVVATGKDFSAEDVLAAGAQEFLHKQDMSPSALTEKVLHAVARRKVDRAAAATDAKLAEVKTVAQECGDRLAGGAAAQLPTLDTRLQPASLSRS